MVDPNDPEVIVALDTRARNLSGLADPARIEEELDAMHRAAQGAFTAQGLDEIEAWLAADAIVQRLRQLVGNYKRASAAREEARAAREPQG